MRILKNEVKKFYYHQKVNLNIYPNKIATVFYTGGCNFQCKTCFHPEYVFIKQNMQEIKEEENERELTGNKEEEYLLLKENEEKVSLERTPCSLFPCF